MSVQNPMSVQNQMSINHYYTKLYVLYHKSALLAKYLTGVAAVAPEMRHIDEAAIDKIRYLHYNWLMKT